MKVCIKCGGDGHTNTLCRGPVTSFGLIVYAAGSLLDHRGRLYPRLRRACNVHCETEEHGEDERHERKEPDKRLFFLLVERKDTVGFLNIVQGSYPDAPPYKDRKLRRYCYELTCDERHRLCHDSFASLWKVAGTTKRDVHRAERRFQYLDIQRVLERYPPCAFSEADYLMPKGRLRRGESTRACAVREFAEETGYDVKDVDLDASFAPYEDHFIGTDGKSYRNVFYVARLKDDALIRTPLGEDPNQSKEVRNVGWFTLAECTDLIRPYHRRKIDILHDVAKKLAQ